MEVLVVWYLSLLEMDTVTPVQILDLAVFIAHSSNRLRIGMHPTILPPAMGK